MEPSLHHQLFILCSRSQTHGYKPTNSGVTTAQMAYVVFSCALDDKAAKSGVKSDPQRLIGRHQPHLTATLRRPNSSFDRILITPRISLDCNKQVWKLVMLMRDIDVPVSMGWLSLGLRITSLGISCLAPTIMPARDMPKDRSSKTMSAYRGFR